MTTNTPSSSAPAAPEKNPANLAPRPWVILVVDDELDIRNSTTELLEQSIPGVRVLAAASGRIGLEILERERVDLVLSDYKMPGMDGIEFLVQVRRMRPGLPRMMFTAFADKALAHRAVSEAVVDDFLAKNLTPGQMTDKVAALLHYAPESLSEDGGEGPLSILDKRTSSTIFTGQSR